MLPHGNLFDIITSMEDPNKPVVDVNLSEDGMTATVTVKFLLLSQAFAFGEVCRTLLEKMPEVAKVPEL